MTTKSPKLWTRLSEALRIKRREKIVTHELPEVGEDGLLVEPAEPPPDVEFEAEPASEKPSRGLTRWPKRDQTLAKLQEGYEQVTQFIEQIRNHLDAQADRSERICTSLEQLAKSMTDVPAISQQAQTLEQMAAQLEAAGTSTEKLADSMSDMPKIARAQGETLTGINRQLEMAGEQSVVAGQIMDKLGNAINMVGETSHAQAEALKQMDTKANEQNELLTRIISRQSRRFVMLFIVTLVLTAAAITLGVLALVMRGG